MRRIGLLSDTHGYIDERILKLLSETDEVWHAGDIGNLTVVDEIEKIKPLVAVYGNIDGNRARMRFPLHQRFVCEGLDVWITHIGGYPGRYSPAIRSELYTNPPKLFICGHSHILKVMFDKKLQLMHMNPGAAGNVGFHLKRTMLRFSIEKGELKDLEAIELGDRSTKSVHGSD